MDLLSLHTKVLTAVLADDNYTQPVRQAAQILLVKRRKQREVQKAFRIALESTLKRKYETLESLSELLAVTKSEATAAEHRMISQLIIHRMI